MSNLFSNPLFCLLTGFIIGLNYYSIFENKHQRKKRLDKEERKELTHYSPSHFCSPNCAQFK